MKPSPEVRRNEKRWTLLLLMFWRSKRTAALSAFLFFGAHSFLVSRALGWKTGWPATSALAAASRANRPGERPSIFTAFPPKVGAASRVGASARRSAVSSIGLFRSEVQDPTGVIPTRLPDPPKGLSGFLTPENAGKMESGVPLSEQELSDGLLKHARPDSPATTDGARDVAKALSPSDDPVPSLLDRLTGPARAGARLSSYSNDQPAGATSASSVLKGRPLCVGKECATHHLAEAVAYSCTAAPGGTSCPKSFEHCSGRGCPAEFAARTAGAPFAGALSGSGKLFLAPSEPVPVLPDAQPALLAQTAQAERLQECERALGGGNASVASANHEFAGCCNRVESAWQSCAAGCSGDGHCLGRCGEASNRSSWSCEQSYLGAYASVSAAGQKACGGSASGREVGLSAWNVPYHCARH